MIRVNPLTLLLINFFLPIFIFLGKGTLFEIVCFFIGAAILMLFKHSKQLFYFLILYLGIRLLIAGVNFLSIEIVTTFFGTFFYIIVRMIPVMMISWVLVKDIRSNEMLSALEKIYLPKKIILSITVALRFFPTYQTEIKMIRESLKMRNIHLSLFQPVKYLEFWLVPILIRASMIAEEMTATAITKGVEAPVPRTSYYQVKMSTLDYSMLIGIVTIFSCLLLGGKLFAEF